MGKILVVSPTPTHPQNAGNRARLFTLLSALKNQGHEIHLLYTDWEQGSLWSGDLDLMRQCWDGFYPIKHHKFKHGAWLMKRLTQYFPGRLAIPFGVDDIYDEALSDFVHQLKHKITFDTVIAVYVFFSKVFECFGEEVLKVLDTLDIFTNRHRLFYEVNQRPEWLYTTQDQERKGINRADVILAIHEKDQKFFSNITKKTVVTLGHLSKPVAEVSQKISDKKKLLFLGSGNHANIHALRYFLNHVFPSLRQSLPYLEFDILGSVCQKVGDLPLGCHKIGQAEDLVSFYQNADILINPVNFGTGLKIKNIEALYYGKALVTTTVGAEGLEDGVGTAFWVADTPQEMQQKIKLLAEDDERRFELAQEALAYARQYRQRQLETLLKVMPSEVLL